MNTTTTLPRMKKSDPPFNVFWEQMYGKDDMSTLGLWGALQGRFGKAAGIMVYEQRVWRSYRLHECMSCGDRETARAFESTLIKVVPSYYLCPECAA